MNYTFDTKVGDGTTTSFTFGFVGPDEGYVDLRRDLRVFVNGVAAAFTTSFADPNKVFITPAPAAGASILIRRVMPRNQPYTDFKGGNAFTPSNLNYTALQQLYLTQELLDGFYDQDFYLKQDLNMGGHKLFNLAPGNGPGQSVNWDQLTAVDNKHTQWNISQDQEIAAIKVGMVDNVSSRTVPWLHVATGGETTIKPPFKFQSAWVWRDGVMQYQLDGAFSIGADSIVFPATDPLRVGEKVLIAMGSTAAAPDDHPSFQDVLNMLMRDGASAGIGQLMYVADLRSTEPTVNTAVVSVKQHSNGSRGGGGNFVADMSDNTTPDDGILYIRTSGGNLWRRQHNGLLSVTWFGLMSDDVTSSLQAAIQYVVNYVVSSKSFTSLPPITIPGGKYRLTTNIHSAPFVDIRSAGGEVTLRTVNDTGAFTVNNNWAGIWNNDYPGMDASSAAVFLNGVNGRINLVGLGSTVSTKVGVILGNDTITDVLPVREPLMDNVLVTGYQAAVKLTTKHTYLCSFNRCRFEKNNINLLFDDTTARNSGERVSFTNCIMGDSLDSHMLHNCSGMNLNFLNCSFDFTKGRMIRFGASGAYSNVRFAECWIEHWDGDLVRQAGQIAGAGPNTVTFSGSTLLARNSTFNSLRPLFSADSPINIEIDYGSLLNFEQNNNKLSGALINYDDVVSNNNVNLRFHTLRSRANYLTKYGDAINLVQLSGTDGTNITTIGDASIGIDVVASAGASAAYNSVSGRKTIAITHASASDTTSLYYRTPVACSGLQLYYAMCSLYAAGSSGPINVSGLARSFSKDTVTGGVLTENLLGTSADTTVDMRPFFASPNPTPGESQFIATPPLPSAAFRRSFYVKPGLRFTGFTGTINITLPAWWVEE